MSFAKIFYNHNARRYVLNIMYQPTNQNMSILGMQKCMVLLKYNHPKLRLKLCGSCVQSWCAMLHIKTIFAWKSICTLIVCNVYLGFATLHKSFLDMQKKEITLKYLIFFLNQNGAQKIFNMQEGASLVLFS